MNAARREYQSIRDVHILIIMYILLIIHIYIYKHTHRDISKNSVESVLITSPNFMSMSHTKFYIIRSTHDLFRVNSGIRLPYYNLLLI